MGCQGISKCILFLFNIIFFLAGMIPFVIGIIALASPSTISQIIKAVPGTSEIPDIIDLEQLILSAAIYMTVLGGAIGLVGFLGCCGAMCRNKYLLGAYCTFLVVFLAAEVAIIVLAIFFPKMLDNWAQQLMFEGLTKFTQDINFNGSDIILPTDAVSLAWHSLQFEIACCGVYNYTDYADDAIKWTNNHPSDWPVSCCKLNSGAKKPPTFWTEFADLDQCLNSGDAQFVNADNCFSVVRDFMTNSSYIVIGVFAGIMGLEVILLIMSCCLCKREEKKSSKCT